MLGGNLHLVAAMVTTPLGGVEPTTDSGMPLLLVLQERTALMIVNIYSV